MACALSISEADLEQELAAPLDGRRWAVSRNPAEHTQIGLFVEKSRKSRKLLLSELSELTGLSLSLLFEIENGDPPEVHSSDLARLAKALDVDYDELRRLADAFS